MLCGWEIEATKLRGIFPKLCILSILGYIFHMYSSLPMRRKFPNNERAFAANKKF